MSVIVDGNLVGIPPLQLLALLKAEIKVSVPKSPKLTILVNEL